MFYELMFKNVIDFKNDLSEVVGYLPAAWALIVKHFVPSAILILFSLGCDGVTATGQKELGHYGGYPTAPYQVLGILIVVFAGFLFVSSIIFPRMYEALKKPDVSATGKAMSSVHAAPEDGEATKDVESSAEKVEQTEPESAFDVVVE